MLPLVCMAYWQWCALTSVSTCAAVNTCTKHKKQCSKGKSPVRSSKEGSNAKKKCMDEVALPLVYTREVYPSRTVFVSLGHPNLLIQKAWKVIWEGTSAHTPVPGMLYITIVIIINLSCICQLIICDVWSKGPSSMPSSPSGNNVDNTINLNAKTIEVRLLITF